METASATNDTGTIFSEEGDSCEKVISEFAMNVKMKSSEAVRINILLFLIIGLDNGLEKRILRNFHVYAGFLVRNNRALLRESADTKFGREKLVICITTPLLICIHNLLKFVSSSYYKTVHFFIFWYNLPLELNIKCFKTLKKIYVRFT